MGETEIPESEPEREGAPSEPPATSPSEPAPADVADAGAERSRPSAPPRRPSARRRRRARALKAGLFALAPLFALLLAFGVDRALKTGCVLRGVTLAGRDLSGLDRVAARALVNELAAGLAAAPLEVRVRGKSYTLAPGEVGFALDVEATLDRAFAAGRQGGPLAEIGFWLGRFASRVEVTPSAALDRDRLEALETRWEADAIPDPPFDGAIVARDGAVAADYPRAGKGLDRGAGADAVLAALMQEPRAPLELPEAVRDATRDRGAVDDALGRARKLTAGAIVLAAEIPPPPATVEQPGAVGPDKSPPAGRKGPAPRKPPPKPKPKKKGPKTPDAEAAPAAPPIERVELTVSARELAETLRSRWVRGEGEADRLELAFAPEGLEKLLAPLRQKLDRPTVDARFVVGDDEIVRIVPSQGGFSVDAAKVATALYAAAERPERRGALPLDPGPAPAFTTEQALALGITHFVSEFTTHHPCCQPRVKNIHRIADLLDGTVVKPGATLSLNELVGRRTEAHGFVPAPSIEEGEMVDTIGGGISQFATTFFNAAFYGGYDIVERTPHSYYFNRYPMGHEATLSYPKPDLVIHNDTEAGLLIKTAYTATGITVKFFGNNGGRRVQAERSAILEVVKPPVKLVPNPRLEPDDHKLEERGAVGWSVWVSRVLTLPDGTSKKEKRKVVYKPKTRRVQVHPCKIPEGEEGYTGERCPEKEPDEHEPGDKDAPKSAEELIPFELPPGGGETAPGEERPVE